MSPFTLSDDLALAREAVATADLISLNRFRAQDLVVNTKPDRTPVTDADTAVEDVIRASLKSARLGDAILGEERGTTSDSLGPQPGRQWVIDPIDGTANFLRGVPIWATLIALAVDGDPLVSVVSAPALGQQWWAAAGLGAWTSRAGQATPRKLEVSNISRFEDAIVNYNSLPGWIADARETQVRALAMSAWRARAIGDFWPYMLVAEGAIDVAGEADLQPYDMAALVPIIREAGGRFSSLDGDDDVWHGTALASNTLLHDTALALTRKRG
jgi:histidinol-phosphatase